MNAPATGPDSSQSDSPSQDELLKVALKHLPLIVFAQDVNLRYTAFYAPHLSSLPSYIGKTDHEVYSTADAEHLVHYKRRVIRTGYSIHFGIELTIANQKRVLDLTLEPQMDAQGNVCGLTGAALDITARKETEDALRRSEARYHQLFSAITEGYGIFKAQFDPQGTINDFLVVDVNPALADWLNRSSRDLVGTTVRQVLPSFNERWLEQISQMLKTGQPLHTELDLPILPRYFDVHAFRLHDTQFAVLAIDVTNRRLVEQQREKLLAQLGIEHARLQAIIDQIPAGLVLCDAPTGKLVTANQQMAQIWRLPIDQFETIESYHLERGFHLDGTLYKAGEWPLVRSIQTGEVVTNEEMVITRGDGTRGVLSVYSTPVHDPNGNIVAGVAIDVDITERKQTELFLRTTLSLVQELYDTSRAIGTTRTPEDVLRVLVPTSYLKGCNYAYMGVFNTPWQPDQEPPDTLTIIGGYHEGDGTDNRIGQTYPVDKPWMVSSKIDQEPFCESELGADRTTGERQWKLAASVGARSLITLPLISGGSCYGLAVFYYSHPRTLSHDDMRHIQGLADQAAAAVHNMRLLGNEARARHEAEHANALRLRFLAMISHELRTPLTSIKGFATTLLADDVTWDTATQHDFIQTIDQEADKLTDMIDQILDLSRIESGNLRIELHPVTLEEIFKNCYPQLATLAQNHVLEVVLPEGLPEVTADRQRITQVVSNLVSNAVKYSPAGRSITIKVLVEASDVRIEVADEGAGISPEDMEHLFEAFQRGSNERTRRMKGAGLGLAICKGIVEAHGGRIWVERSDSTGTTFAFTIPLSPQ